MMIGMPQAQSTPQAGISSDFILPPFSRQGWRGSVRQIALAGEAECQQLGTPVSPPRLRVTTQRGPGDDFPDALHSSATSPRPHLAKLPSSNGSRPCEVFLGCRCGAGAL